MELITSENRFKLTRDQQRVFYGFKKFIGNENQKVFILRGYAGTGKTTLISYFINELKQRNKSFLLMASTGRAAKIVSDKADADAYTVHSVIYNFKDFNQDLEEVAKVYEEQGVDKTGQLFLNFELTPIHPKSDLRRIYIIDEASMISDVKDKIINQAKFGSGRLLKDLFDYDINGKFIFVGDECQLPPIDQGISPALSMEYIKNIFNVDVTPMTLNEIVRQQADNSIIQASHNIRKLFQNPPKVKWGMLPLGSYDEINIHTDAITMINNYISIIKNKNFELATFITHSNSKCNSINKLIRQSLGYRTTLQEGDLLLVTQNNHVTGLMNGDMVVVEQIGKARYQRAQLTFMHIEVRELASGKRVSLLLIEDILYSGKTNLLPTQQKALFIDFFIRMKEKGIKQNHANFKDALLNDEYLNALRAVYGYAITCHKAQGGEWDDVFVDIRRNLTLEAGPDAYQWIYTAVTRAKERLHVVKDFFIV